MRLHRINFSDQCKKGFTLIELLIVLVIISVVVTIATLSLSHFNRSQRLKLTADRLVHVFQIAEQQAILQPAILGLTINSHRYQFSQWVPGDDHVSGKFVSLSHDHLSGTVNDNIILSSQASGSSLSKAFSTHKILFFQNSNVTPFTLKLFDKNNKKKHYVLTIRSDGLVKLISS